MHGSLTVWLRDTLESIANNNIVSTTAPIPMACATILMGSVVAV
jgi:hypothetical protein